MVLFRDLLAEHQAEEIVIDSINIGDVYRLNLTPKEGVVPKNEGDDGRNKMFVILGQNGHDKLIGAVLINSSINKNLSLKIQQLQYPLYAKDCIFLNHNSYVDCSNIKDISFHKFLSCGGKNGYIGQIPQSDLELIVSTVKDSPTITPKKLQQYNIDNLFE